MTHAELVADRHEPVDGLPPDSPAGPVATRASGRGAHALRARRRSASCSSPRWPMPVTARCSPGCARCGLIGVRAAASYRDRHVLVPHQRRKQARPGVVVERTRNLPAARTSRQGLPLAPVARCSIDAARQLDDRASDVRELVAEVVQRRLCTVKELTDALAAAANQRSALPREVLGEVQAGVRSVAEAHAREVFARHGIPPATLELGALHGGRRARRHPGRLVGRDRLRAADRLDALPPRAASLPAHSGSCNGRSLATTSRSCPSRRATSSRTRHAFVAEVRAFLATHAGHRPTTALVARPPDSGPRVLERRRARCWGESLRCTVGAGCPCSNQIGAGCHRAKPTGEVRSRRPWAGRGRACSRAPRR